MLTLNRARLQSLGKDPGGVRRESFLSKVHMYSDCLLQSPEIEFFRRTYSWTLNVIKMFRFGGGEAMGVCVAQLSMH